MIDAFGLRRIIVAGGFGVIGSSFVHTWFARTPREGDRARQARLRRQYREHRVVPSQRDLMMPRQEGHRGQVRRSGAVGVEVLPAHSARAPAKPGPPRPSAPHHCAQRVQMEKSGCEGVAHG